MLLLEIVTRKRPYDDKNDMGAIEEIKNNRIPQIPYYCPSNWKETIQKCLKKYGKLCFCKLCIFFFELQNNFKLI